MEIRSCIVKKLWRMNVPCGKRRKNGTKFYFIERAAEDMNSIRMKTKARLLAHAVLFAQFVHISNCAGCELW